MNVQPCAFFFSKGYIWVDIPAVIQTANRYSFMVHIGHFIRDELRRQERTPTWLARKICCGRTNIYDIFERASLDSALIHRISLALNINLFALLSDNLVRESQEKLRNRTI